MKDQVFFRWSPDFTQVSFSSFSTGRHLSQNDCSSFRRPFRTTQTTFEEPHLHLLFLCINNPYTNDSNKSNNLHRCREILYFPMMYYLNINKNTTAFQTWQFTCRLKRPEHFNGNCFCLTLWRKNTKMNVKELRFRMKYLNFPTTRKKKQKQF